MISENLRGLRAVLGLTHAQMGKVARVSARSWQDYESGIKTPGGRVFEALALEGINTNWIFTCRGQMLLHRPEEADGRLVHPGLRGHLYGQVLRRLATSPPFRGQALEKLGEYAAFVFDVTPAALNYAEQLQRIDSGISWLARVIYGKDPGDASVACFSDVVAPPGGKLGADKARVVELIEQLATAGVQKHNLACNFVDHIATDHEWELDFRMDSEDVRGRDITWTRHDLVKGGWVEFDPFQPERGFLESIANPKICIEVLESMVASAQQTLRVEIDRLLKLGIDVKPEHLSRNLQLERVVEVDQPAQGGDPSP